MRALHAHEPRHVCGRLRGRATYRLQGAVFLGQPRERNVDSSPNWSAVSRTQSRFRRVDSVVVRSPDRTTAPTVGLQETADREAHSDQKTGDLRSDCGRSGDQPTTGRSASSLRLRLRLIRQIRPTAQKAVDSHKKHKETQEGEFHIRLSSVRRRFRAFLCLFVAIPGIGFLV